MRKLIAIGMALCIFAVLASAASASGCGGPGQPACPAPTPIKVPTATFPSGSFNTYSSGSFTGGLNGYSTASADGTCAAQTLSATKITQVGNGGLIESGGLAAASGDSFWNPSSAESYSQTQGSATFDGTGNANGVAQ